MSLSIAQRLPTPSNEWAEHTAQALSSTHVDDPSAASNTQYPAQMTPSIASSALSTPGLDIPGAFPKFKSQSANAVIPAAPVSDNSPHAAVDKLADAAPPKDLDVETLKKEAQRLFEAAKQYLPEREHMHNAVGSAAVTAGQYLPEREKVRATAGQYFPEGIVHALGLPADKNDTADSTTAADLDPTSTAKPVLITPSTSTLDASSDKDIDGASVRAIPPSTRSPSYQVDSADTYSNTNFGAPLDPTSGAKLSSTYSATSPSRVPLPVSDVSPTSPSFPHSAPAESANVASAVDETVSAPSVGLPTPPPSDTAVPSASSQLRKEDVSGVSGPNAYAAAFSPDEPVVETQEHALSEPNSNGSASAEESGNGKADGKSPRKEKGVKGLVQRVKGRLQHRNDGH